MSLIKLSIVSLGLALSCIVAGCAADGPDGDDDEDLTPVEDSVIAATIKAGTFKLYKDPRHTPSAFCDVHTVLEIANTGGATASLHETVTGTCKLMVQPDARQYRLKLAPSDPDSSCGSKVYKGSKKIGGKTRNIRIVDHRTRTCKDLPEAKVIVDETDRASTETVTKFSSAAAAVVVCQSSASCSSDQHCSVEDGVCNSTGMLAVCSGTCVVGKAK